ncbi:MAG TPA: DegT/DnrJ/EryC1/StrS family aminotransferase [Bryobacteraceae bacterium]|nr:DegT/DnrJ/EryC1/StrS family aminotransferase [Bryobacteraceae bacterium]
MIVIQPLPAVKVPLLDLKPQTLALAGELTSAFTRVLNSGRFILGPEVEEFERNIAALTGAKHAIGVSSGTDAILLALMALGIGPGDEVICPSFTFFATGGCVTRAGATPVFADCCPASFNLDVKDAARRITARTRAIIPVDLFGQVAEMDPITELARQHGLAVIEDAAQALGACYRGRRAGSIGDFGTFSFYPSKNLGALGDAGLLTTNDDELASKARLLRTHGENPKYFHHLVGGNFRMDPLQAALLGVKLPHLAEYTRRRQENAAYYTHELGKIRGVGDRVILPVASPHNHHIWNQYTLRMTKRDALRSFLAEREIGTEIYYPRPLHLQECFAVAGRTPQPLPVSERLAEECVSIPIFPDLTREQQDFVVGAIGDFLAETA